MSILSVIREQSTYLKTNDAAKYLNYRSECISGQSPNYSSEKVRGLARCNELKHTKTSDNGNYLFKVNWLEKYIKNQHGDKYSRPVAGQSRYLEFDTNANTHGNNVAPTPPDQNTALHSSGFVNKWPDDLLSKIKNSPPLIYLSALTVGFLTGSGTNIGQSLIDLGYFTERVSVSSSPIEETAAARIATAIQKEEPETALGSRLRNMESKSQGPFKSLKKNIRIHFLDASNLDENSELHTYIIAHAAAVCDNSSILNSKILINAEKITSLNHSAKGLIEFSAFLQDKNICAFGPQNSQYESVIVSRETFDKEFQMSTEDYEFVDVVAHIDSM